MRLLVRNFVCMTHDLIWRMGFWLKWWMRSLSASHNKLINVCAFDALSLQLHSHRAQRTHNIKSRKLISLPEKLIKGKCYSAAGRSKRKENALARAHTARQHQKAAERGKYMYAWVLCRSIKIYWALLPSVKNLILGRREQHIFFLVCKHGSAYFLFLVISLSATTHPIINYMWLKRAMFYQDQKRRSFLFAKLWF